MQSLATGASSRPLRSARPDGFFAFSCSALSELPPSGPLSNEAVSTDSHAPAVKMLRSSHPLLDARTRA